MTFAPLGNLKKNGISTTTTGDITAIATTIPVLELACFHDQETGALIIKGLEMGYDDTTESRTEEITPAAASATSGPGNLTGCTRGVKADGSIGTGYAWPSGTRVRVGFSKDVYDQIRDNFDALPQSRNAIINGHARVHQRGTTYPLVKDAYTWDSDHLNGPDRHEGMATGTAVSAGTWNQTTSATPGSTGYGFKFINVTLTGTGILYHRTRIEARDAIKFKNQIASFSCKVYHDSTATNYTVYVRKADASDNFAAVTAISNSGPISIPNATTTDLKYENIDMGDCAYGIEIEIKIECGAITTKSFTQTELQFELGPVATAYAFIPYDTELSLCKRYYQKLLPSQAYGSYLPIFCDTTTSAIGVLQYSQKRANPTIAFSAVDDYLIRIKGGATVASTNIAATAVGVNSATITTTVAAGLTAGEGGILTGKNSTTHYITIESEL